MKKVIALLCCAAIIFSLAACGAADSGVPDAPASDSAASEEQSDSEAPAAQESEPQEPAEPASEEIPEEPEAPEEPEEPETPAVDVSFPLVKDGESATLSVCWDMPNILTMFGINDPMDETFWREMQDRSGVTLEFNLSANADEFPLMVAGGDYPDIFWNCNSFITTLGGDEFALDNDIIIDFGPYLQDYAPDYAKVLEEYSDYENIYRSPSGAYLYFCMFYENNARDMGMVLRSDWLEEQNLDIPETVEDLDNVLRTFKSAYDPAYPLGAFVDTMSNGAVVDCGVATAFGNTYGSVWAVDPYAQDGETIRYAPLEDQWKNYITQLHTWYEDGILNSDFMSFNNITDKMPAVYSGQMGVFNDEISNFETFSQNIRETSGDEDAQLLGVPYPVQKAGDLNHLANVVLVCRKLGYAISGDCEDPELACMFLNYLYTEEGSLLCNYGVEGEGFTYNEEGKPVFTDTVIANPDIPFALAMNKYCVQQGSMLCDMDRTRAKFTENDYRSMDLWAQNDDAWVVPDAVTYTTEESSEISRIMGDINSYLTERQLQFIVGDLDIETEWDSYVQDIYNMGIEDAMEIWQTAYDRFNGA